MTIAPISFSAALPAPMPPAAVDVGKVAPAAAQVPVGQDTCCISAEGRSLAFGMALVAALMLSPSRREEEEDLAAKLMIGAALLQALAGQCPYIEWSPGGTYSLSGAVGEVMASSAAMMFPGGAGGFAGALG